MSQGKEFIRNTVLVVVILLVFSGIYMGAYRPFVKGRLYIEKSRELGSNQYSSVQELIENYDEIFNYLSPVGQEEVINFFLSDVLKIISQNDLNQDIAETIVKYTESKMVENNLIQNLNFGHIYFRLWERFGNDEYFIKAENYYLSVLNEAPILPHALEALFRLYGKAGKTNRMLDIGKRIKDVWPEHPLVKSTQFLQLKN